MDLRGIKHPRHAGLPSRLPVNSNQARLDFGMQIWISPACSQAGIEIQIHPISIFKEQCKGNNWQASSRHRQYWQVVFLTKFDLSCYEEG
jgi:hypothetical protein